MALRQKNTLKNYFYSQPKKHKPRTFPINVRSKATKCRKAV
ncbi:hypothetical protein l11_09700 [Neisseria weaveri LMG 5135]|nr:hypothetical protein l11_09700 [Neisseria weaveri LMG 5135]